jgi:hypothetical protein
MGSDRYSLILVSLLLKYPNFAHLLESLSTPQKAALWHGKYNSLWLIGLSMSQNTLEYFPVHCLSSQRTATQAKWEQVKSIVVWSRPSYRFHTEQTISAVTNAICIT